MTQLSPSPIFQAFNTSGGFLVGGLLYTYAAGTSTPVATYQDSAGLIPNTNPVVLNTTGSAAVWLNAGQAYKFNLTDSAGNQIPGYPVDNIFGALSGNILPAATNTYNLGSSTLTWANGYFGTAVYVNGVAVPTYPKSAAEAAAGVLIVNGNYPWGNWLRYGADPTGVIDATNAINNSLLANTISYGPGGTYLISSSLTPKSNQIMYGDGPGTIITSSSAAQVHISMALCTGTVVRDMSIISTAGAGSGHPAAVYLQNCTACTVERLEISGMWGFGIWLDCSNECNINNNYLFSFQGAGNFGDIAIYCLSSSTAGATQNVIANNQCMGGTNYFGIQLQDPDSATASSGFPRRNLVTGNRVGPHLAYGIVHYMSGSAGSPPPATDTLNQITNNYIQSITGSAFTDSGAGIYAVGIGNGGLVVTGNTIFNCCINTTTRSLAPAGIGIAQVSAGLTPALIANNNVSGMGQGDGILITSSPGGAEITGNVVNMPSNNNGTGPGGGTLVGNGIHVVASSNVDVGPNNVVAYGTGAPIQVYTAGFNCVDISFTGGNYSALNTNTASAMQVINNSTFTISRLTVSGGNYNNVSTTAGVAAMNISAVSNGSLTGVTMNALGTAPALSIQGSTQMSVTGCYLNSGGTVAIFTAGTCTNGWLNNCYFGTSATAINNGATGFIIEGRLPSVPTTGTWAVGDRIYNSAPTAGGVFVWVNTVAGSPGTFKTVSNT